MSIWTEHHVTVDIQTRQDEAPRSYSASSEGLVQIFGVSLCYDRTSHDGDYLFDPASGSQYSKDDDHIAQIMELLGEIPKSVAFAGKNAGELRCSPLEFVMDEKYLFPVEEADALAAFLTPMLRPHHDKRVRASELMCH
ncbi:hypothetical protein DXG01_002810 [Tephrocybe rancida]|nr:hypothetical protein DXG01_002810 [Tephrocybe rancida]